MSISRPSLQTVKSLMQELISDIEHALVTVRKFESSVWDQCDPKDPESVAMFEDLNAIRTHKRVLKRRLAQYQRAQTEVKRAISGDK